MEPNEIIKYIFKERNVDYEMRKTNGSHRNLSMAKYISIYLIDWFYPMLIRKDQAVYFGYSKASSASIAIRKIRELMQYNKQLRADMDKYLLYIRSQMSLKKKVVGSKVSIKLLNKRIILKKTSQGFDLTIKRLNDRVIESRNIVLTSEAMEAIINAYKILN